MRDSGNTGINIRLGSLDADGSAVASALPKDVSPVRKPWYGFVLRLLCRSTPAAAPSLRDGTCGGLRCVASPGEPLS